MLCVRIIVNVLLVLGLADAIIINNAYYDTIMNNNDANYATNNNKNKNNNNNEGKPEFDVEKFVKHIIDVKIWSKLHYRSVYINEIENIDLKPFLLDKNTIGQKNVNRVLMGLIVGLKCQCAHSISDSLGYVIQNMTPQYGSTDDRDNSSPKPEYSKNDVDVSYLKITYDTIALSIDIIFQINDIIPNLKSNEPSFLKQLLSMHLYLNKLIRFHNYMNEIKDVVMVDSIQGDIIDAGFNGEKNRYLADYVDDVFMTDSVQVHYMISQMMNLLHGFIVLNCSSSDINTTDKYAFDELREDLTNLKARIQSFLSNGLHTDTTTVYNVDDAMLIDLFGDSVFSVVGNSDNSPTDEQQCCFPFIDYLMKASVKIQQDYDAVSIQHIFKQSIRTYDIEVVYKYLSSIYDVLLKMIYQQINKLVDIINKNKSNDDNVYSDSLKKLIKDIFYFPIDIISDLNLLMKFYKNKIFKAAEIVENRLKSLSHIQLPETSEYNLNEIATIIGDSKFQQFWRVFCSLRFAEAGKNSDYVYETSLKLIYHSGFAENDNYLYTLNYECETLNNIYYNFFRINIMIENFKDLESTNPNLTKDDNIFAKIHKYNLIFMNHLTEVIEVWSQSKNFNFSDDLLKILMNTLIRLKNIHFYIDLFNRRIEKTIQTNILNNNIDNLGRIGEYVMHLLDNYQICNCKTTNNLNSNYKYFEENPILNYDIYNTLLLFNIPIVTSSIEQDPDYNMVSENTEKSRSIQYLPKKWYRLLFFIKKNQFFSCTIMKLFAENIRFNWNGVVNNIRDQINLLKTTLSLKYLVEYVSNYFKWIISSMYFALINLFCSGPMEPGYEALDQINLADHLTRFTSLEFPENCKPYIDIIKNICTNQTINFAKAYEIKYSVTAEIEKFGIVDVDQTFNNIKEKIISGKYNYILVISTIITETEKFLNALQKYVHK